ncbi:MAG TPA: CBS domain-containing protein [Actinomycetota bacterium]|nr:CBS domain-containing protein [Actinomycetota bacterium]
MADLKLRDVMTPDPITIQATAPVVEAARMMRDSDVGDVIVMNDGSICGIVTDRDIVVRAIADGDDPRSLKVSDVCSQGVACMAPDDSTEEAAQMMRERAIRRLPVVENDMPVGIVSLGDLAQMKDPNSALADISAAPPNN